MPAEFPRVEYSPDVDALVIRVGRERPDYAKEVGGGIIIHYSRNSKPVEVEILDASRIITSSLRAVLKKARTKVAPAAR